MKKTIAFPNLENKSFKERFIGDKKFYRLVLSVAVPIMIQNGITNFVGLLDNVMVGAVGTEQMSGVSIANQVLMIFYLCVFGGLSGVGIFTAQYFGKNDLEGVRSTFRFKAWLVVAITAVFAVVYLLFGPQFIALYINGDSDITDGAATLKYGAEYMKIILISFPASLVLNLYASTLRECGETKVPMVAGIIAVLVNLGGNWLLIFGNLGCPALGSNGAAIATVTSRYVEAAIVLIWAHTHQDKQLWIKGVYRTLRVPKKEIVQYVKKGMPLLLNETLWSAGMAVLTQCYSMRGINAIAGLNIANTINNCLNIVFVAMGSAVAIIVGQLLGAGKFEEAKDTDNKMMFFAILSGLLTSALLVGASFFFPNIYNTNEEAKQLASLFIIGYAVFTPQNAFMHCSYFTLRSGGKTIITFIFDSLSIWAVSIPIAFLLSRLTALPVIWIFVFVNIGDWVKVVLGYILLKKNIWIQNIVAE